MKSVGSMVLAPNPVRIKKSSSESPNQDKLLFSDKIGNMLKVESTQRGTDTANQYVKENEKELLSHINALAAEKVLDNIDLSGELVASAEEVSRLEVSSHDWIKKLELLTSDTNIELRTESEVKAIDIKSDAEVMGTKTPDGIINIDELISAIELDEQVLNKETSESQLQQVIQPLIDIIQNLISKAEGVSFTEKNTNKLLEHLEKWTNLLKQGEKGIQIDQLIKSGGVGEESKLKFVLANITDTYQKRTFMENSGKYKTQATVSSSDITKWIKQALNRYAQDNTFETAEPKYQFQTAIPMSKAEQFTVHMQLTNQGTIENQELMQEFEQVLKTSKFNQVNGTTELIMKLKPGNLGEVLVKMIEVDGEIIVRLSVTSQASKDLLESNLHQLKHMFSPSQVTIEKMENNADFQENYQPDDKREGFKEDNSAEEDTYEESFYSDEMDETSQTSFSDLLNLEKAGNYYDSN